jgi:hypothetical protein
LSGTPDGAVADWLPPTSGSYGNLITFSADVEGVIILDDGGVCSFQGMEQVIML